MCPPLKTQERRRARRRLRLPATALLAGAMLTACRPDRLPPAPGEVDRPLLVQTDFVSPDPEAIGIDPASAVEVRFNEPMDPRTFEDHLLLKTPDGSARSGSYSALDSSVRFKPASQLDPARLHRVELRGRVRDANGNSIERNGQPVLDDTTLIFRSWFFTSGPYDQGDPRSYILDTRGRIWTVQGFVQESGRITEGLGSAPKGLARAGSRLVALNPAARQAILYDATSGEVVTTVPVPQDPTAVAAHASDAFVVSGRGQAVTRIDAASGTVSRQYALGFFAAAIAVSPDGSRLYTLDQSNGDLAVVNVATGQVTKPAARLVRIPVTGEISVEPGSGNVYVADTRNTRLLVLNPDGTGPIHTLDASILPDGIWRPYKVAFAGNSLFVVSQNTAELHRLDLGTHTISRSYTFDNPIKGIEVLSGGNPLLVLSGVRLLLVDAETGTVMRSVDLPDSNTEAVVTVN